MNKPIAAIGVAALLALFACSLGGSPVKTFEEFADAWADWRTEEALLHVEGATAEKAIREKNAEHVVPISMQNVMGTDYTVLSQSPSSDGESVELQVEQEIRFNPPGVMSAMRATMFARVRHDVTMRKTDDGWKVVSFNPTFLKAGEIAAP